MLKFAGQHVRHGFKAAVRMVGKTLRLTGLQGDAPEVIEQQERITTELLLKAIADRTKAGQPGKRPRK